jgi:hypothetical protein
MMNTTETNKTKKASAGQNREAALAKFLGEDLDEITESTYGENTFHAAGGEYLVLTDEEADQAAYDYIKESVWAFNSSFLADFTGLPEEMFKAVQDKCEGSNEAVLRCIEAGSGLDEFVSEAVAADGRGHFLSSYDGEEGEEGEYFIYRI